MAREWEGLKLTKKLSGSKKKLSGSKKKLSGSKKKLSGSKKKGVKVYLFCVSWFYKVLVFIGFLN